ncbi:anti-sigma factor RsiW [Streptomyces zagrosensis]|uniref:Anti-sigma factor RsiW n=1 Tax=Streptomyces zagrosensis TaxID=1042984 RepID=A0A7W9V191_9ACTN|nr:anti-sigma factor RsiW [Streptomyces zagrosensis]
MTSSRGKRRRGAPSAPGSCRVPQPIRTATTNSPTNSSAPTPSLRWTAARRAQIVVIVASVTTRETAHGLQVRHRPYEGGAARGGLAHRTAAPRAVPPITVGSLPG